MVLLRSGICSLRMLAAVSNIPTIDEQLQADFLATLAPRMDAPPAASAAPPVVAVMITYDPGPWLEEALRCLRAQDYPDLSVLVIDAAGPADPTARVAAVLPGAFVRRLDTNPGFGAAATH